MEKVDVIIGAETVTTTRAQAEILIKQMAKQPDYAKQFYSPIEFKDTKFPE